MSIYVYIFTMAVTTYFVRMLPLTLFRKPIKSHFIRSFLYYVPYVTLAIMTFPAIIHATEQPLAGVLALIAGVIIAWCGADLLIVAVSCCGVVLITEWILTLLK